MEYRCCIRCSIYEKKQTLGLLFIVKRKNIVIVVKSTRIQDEYLLGTSVDAAILVRIMEVYVCIS